MKSQILYEDNDIIVCKKIANFPVQSAKAGVLDMESELKNYLMRKGDKKPYIAVIHRLDQPVRGVLVFGKNQKAAGALSAQLQNNKMKKIYRALVCGTPEKPEGKLTDILIKEPAGNLSKALSEEEYNALPKDVQKEAKQAVLSYKTVESGQELYKIDLEDYPEVSTKDFTELEIHLETGRHHQIRVQMKALGHPILGDMKYGNELSLEVAENLEISSLCLTAYRLEFEHPTTGKPMEFVYESRG